MPESSPYSELRLDHFVKQLKQAIIIFYKLCISEKHEAFKTFQFYLEEMKYHLESCPSSTSQNEVPSSGNIFLILKEEIGGATSSCDNLTLSIPDMNCKKESITLKEMDKELLPNSRKQKSVDAGNDIADVAEKEKTLNEVISLSVKTPKNNESKIEKKNSTIRKIGKICKKSILKKKPSSQSRIEEEIIALSVEELKTSKSPLLPSRTSLRIANQGRTRTTHHKLENLSKCQNMIKQCSVKSDNNENVKLIQINKFGKEGRGSMFDISSVENGNDINSTDELQSIHNKEVRDIKIFHKLPMVDKIFKDQNSQMNLDNEEPITSSGSHSTGDISCKLCRQHFTNEVYFSQHQCEKEVNKLFCSQCKISFLHPQHFHKHMLGHNRNMCKICNSQFAKRKSLCKHLKSVHKITEPEKAYNCPHCSRKFIKRPSLYVHLKEHAGDKIVCMKCGSMNENEQQYKMHMVNHTKEAKFHCIKCDESFLRRQQFEQHQAGHIKYDCTLCKKSYSTKKLLLKHNRLVHGIQITEEKKHVCNICEKHFQRPTLLEIHKRLHTGEKPIQCIHCDKNFRTPKALAKHLKTAAHLKATGQTEMAIQEIEKSFLCAECGAKFFRRQSLSRHMQQLHNEEKPFLCPYCDFKCKCKTNLKRHIELHTKERSFVCEVCGASFHARATLKEHHAYVHSETRDFVCSQCGKGFKGKSGLRRHARIHNDNRPYVCYCEQSYKRMSHLKRHMMAVHGVVFKSKRVSRISLDNNIDLTESLKSSMELTKENDSEEPSFIQGRSNEVLNLVHHEKHLLTVNNEMPTVSPSLVSHEISCDLPVHTTTVNLTDISPSVPPNLTEFDSSSSSTEELPSSSIHSESKNSVILSNISKSSLAPFVPIRHQSSLESTIANTNLETKHLHSGISSPNNELPFVISDAFVSASNSQIYIINNHSFERAFPDQTEQTFQNTASSQSLLNSLDDSYTVVSETREQSSFSDSSSPSTLESHKMEKSKRDNKESLLSTNTQSFFLDSSTTVIMSSLNETNLTSSISVPSLASHSI